jgi:hypothetical protein
MSTHRGLHITGLKQHSNTTLSQSRGPALYLGSLQGVQPPQQHACSPLGIDMQPYPNGSESELGNNT